MREYLDYEEIEAIRKKQIDTNSRTVSAIGPDEYLYRGVKFARDDSVPTGYYGRYTIRLAASLGMGKSNSTDTQAKMKQYIDKLVDEKNS